MLHMLCRFLDFVLIFRGMLLRLLISSVNRRSASTTTQAVKGDNLVQNLFLKKIHEYASKLSAEGEIVPDSSPEVIL